MTTSPRRLGGTFLGGAGGRLLPASVIFRWFGTAVAFHALAWLALAAGAEQWPSWRGGLGWPLAALHLMTLGTLLASAIGASLQLLPVATRQPVRWPGLVEILWWLYVPGVSLLVLGMGLAQPVWLAIGAAAVVAVLLAWGAMLAVNLRGARGMPGVVLHGRGAVAALILLLLSAIALVALWLGEPLFGRDAARALHLAAGVFGVMGLLTLGLSTILLPMFTLAPVPPDAEQIRVGRAAFVALGLAAAAAFAPADGLLAPTLRLIALLIGAWALTQHLRQMKAVIRGGMRPDLGAGGKLMRIGWGCAALALVLALVQVILDSSGRDDAPWLGRLFVVTAVGGWLLSFLLGVLQRILPFLAAMHAARGQQRPPTPSALTLDRALTWHRWAHGSALLLLGAAVISDATALLWAAAVVGFAGALCFAAFFAVLLRRLQLSQAAPHKASASDDQRP